MSFRRFDRLKNALRTCASKSVVEKITLVIRSSLHSRIHWCDWDSSVDFLFGQARGWKSLKTVEAIVCRDQEVNLSDLTPDPSEEIPLDWTRMPILSSRGMVIIGTWCNVTNKMTTSSETHCQTMMKGFGLHYILTQLGHSPRSGVLQYFLVMPTCVPLRR